MSPSLDIEIKIMWRATKWSASHITQWIERQIGCGSVDADYWRSHI